MPEGHHPGPTMVSLSVPISDSLGDSELIGDDLDSLLDNFANEPEASKTHLHSGFPLGMPPFGFSHTSQYDTTDHSQYPNVLLPPSSWYPPTVPAVSPLQIPYTLGPAPATHVPAPSSNTTVSRPRNSALQAPVPQLPASALPTPTPNLPQSLLPTPCLHLPPAFFTSAVSQLNSLDTLSPVGVGDCPAASTLDSLDLTDSFDGLDTLESFSTNSHVGVGGEDTSRRGLSKVLNTRALDTVNGLKSVDKLDSLDNLLDSPPSLKAKGEDKKPKPGPGIVKKRNLQTDSKNKPLVFFDSLDKPPQPAAPTAGFGPKRNIKTLDTLDSLDPLGSFPPVEETRVSWPRAEGGAGGLDSLSDFDTFGTNPPHVALVQPMHPVRKSHHVSNPLASTHDFMQACTHCYPREGRGIYSFVYKPNLVHVCKRDILLCRRKADTSLEWNRVRPRTSRMKFSGPYVLCKELLNSGDIGLCKFGEECTFAFNQCEIDVWTEERKGTLNRSLLFQSLPIKEDPGLCVTRLLQQHNGIFMFLCQECYDNKPRIISKRAKGNSGMCSNSDNSHKFDANKCLVYVVMTTTVNYKKIRPLDQLSHNMEVCRHVNHYGCQREDSCHFAHSFIELETWKLQKTTGITAEEIVKESIKYNQKHDQNKPKMNKASSSGPAVGAGGGAAGGGVCRPKGRVKSLNMKMKFACTQCWKDGLISEPNKALKYCSAKASHIWTKERRMLLVKSLDKHTGKWVQVRPLPHGKNFPLQYDLCAHTVNMRKCTYTGNCTFAHSDEEKELWTYMKDNNLTDMQQMYDMWLSLSSHSRQSDGALLTHLTPATEEKYIAMPTDFAEPMSGFHCHLCGRNSNSERQWQQHISSEKHKDRVFSCEGEDESLMWSYRFPGLRFELCSRLDSGCPDGASCDSAHSLEELQEWKERRSFLRRKLAKARYDMLIMPTEFDFGKYNFLLQDENHLLF